MAGDLNHDPIEVLLRKWRTKVRCFEAEIDKGFTTIRTGHMRSQLAMLKECIAQLEEARKAQ